MTRVKSRNMSTFLKWWKLTNWSIDMKQRCSFGLTNSIMVTINKQEMTRNSLRTLVNDLGISERSLECKGLISVYRYKPLKGHIKRTQHMPMILWEWQPEITGARILYMNEEYIIQTCSTLRKSLIMVGIVWISLLVLFQLPGLWKFICKYLQHKEAQWALRYRDTSVVFSNGSDCQRDIPSQISSSTKTCQTVFIL